MKQLIIFVLSTLLFSCKKNNEDLIMQTQTSATKSTVIAEKKSSDCLQVGTVATPDYDHRKYDVRVEWTKPAGSQKMILVVEVRNVTNNLIYNQTLDVKKDGADSFTFSFSADTGGPWTVTTASYQFKSTSPCGQTSGLITNSIL